MYFINGFIVVIIFMKNQTFGSMTGIEHRVSSFQAGSCTAELRLGQNLNTLFIVYVSLDNSNISIHRGPIVI